MDVNKACEDGATALYLAVENNNIEMVKILLKHPAIDISKRYEGGTVFSLAQKCGFTEIAKILHDHANKQGNAGKKRKKSAEVPFSSFFNSTQAANNNSIADDNGQALKKMKVSFLLNSG
jgi:ankyrin repeat protein